MFSNLWLLSIVEDAVVVTESEGAALKSLESEGRVVVLLLTTSRTGSLISCERHLQYINYYNYF